MGAGPVIDRQAWLEERRSAVEATYDEEAATYDREDTPITPTHRHFVSRLVETCPPGGSVLDIPCGTGKYFAMVVAADRRVVGIDQSAGMLSQAREKDLAVRLEKGGLQELPYIREFDASITVDAMENVPPEDWPTVLANLHRAVRPGGHIYLTVEEVDLSHIDEAFAQATAHGWPAVRGEIVSGDTAGYHYYPSREQVSRWIEDERLVVVDEGENQGKGYGYHHLLLRGRAKS